MYEGCMILKAHFLSGKWAFFCFGGQSNSSPQPKKPIYI